MFKFDQTVLFLSFLFLRIDESHQLPSVLEDIEFCNEQLNFSQEQKEFCYQNTKLVKNLIDGYQLGHRLCQEAFRNGAGGTRWNCTNAVASNKKNVLFNVAHPKEGSKEHSILVSYTSAGMLYNLVKACERNEIPSCRYTDIYNCRRSLSGSCYHLETQVPLRLIRTFFSSSNFAKSRYQKMLNQHNRELGLQKVKSLIRIRFGREYLSPFKGVIPSLQDIYIKQNQRIKRKYTKEKIPTKLLSLRSKLVYTLRDGRFNYCNQNDNWLWNGIGRRACEIETRDYHSFENCVNMCCDYGYVNIPELKEVCVGENSDRECQVQTINKYFCKYAHEAVRSFQDIPWQDFR